MKPSGRGLAAAGHQINSRVEKAIHINFTVDEHEGGAGGRDAIRLRHKILLDHRERALDGAGTDIGDIDAAIVRHREAVRFAA